MTAIGMTKRGCLRRLCPRRRYATNASDEHDAPHVHTDSANNGVALPQTTPQCVQLPAEQANMDVYGPGWSVDIPNHSRRRNSTLRSDPTIRHSDIDARERNLSFGTDPGMEVVSPVPVEGGKEGRDDW